MSRWENVWQHPERPGHQGERLQLRVGHHAAAKLADVLEFLLDDPSRLPLQRQTSLVLPDGRRLEVSVEAVDDGSYVNGRGEWVSEDGQPHVDISGDFAVDAAAGRVFAAATGGYRDRMGGPAVLDVAHIRAFEVEDSDHAWDAAADVDLARIRAAVEQHLVGEVDHATCDRIADRAVDLADATRPERLYTAYRQAGLHLDQPTGRDDHPTAPCDATDTATGRSCPRPGVLWRAVRGRLAVDAADWRVCREAHAAGPVTIRGRSYDDAELTRPRGHEHTTVAAGRAQGRGRSL